MNHRVVITGLGLCTPVGCGVDEFWRNLLAGRSGIGPITRFDVETLPVRIGGEVKKLAVDDLLREFPEAAQVDDRKVWLGLDSARQALQDAALAEVPRQRALLYVGVSLEAFSLAQVTVAVRGGPEGSAMVQRLLAEASWPKLQTPLDCLTQLLGDHYRFDQGRYTNCSACAAGAQVIGEAFHRIREGSTDMALAGAADSALNALGLGGFSLLRILSLENEDPQHACRPFDGTRQGTVLSEGAAFVVLENLAHARARGAKVYAEVVGYATTLDAYRVSDPEPTGQGAARCMTQAITDAGLIPGVIDSVNAHGTGTPKNDIAETLAIKQALGKRAYQIPVPAIKSMTGHMIAASGAVEAVASALSLFTHKIPPTINLKHADPQCDLDYVAEGCREYTGQTVLSNSFGFGGQNATLILRNPSA